MSRVDAAVATSERDVDQETVGGRIAFARRRKGLSQKDLSSAIGRSRTTIVHYEQNKVDPQLGQIVALARALDVTPAFLAFGAEEEGQAETVMSDVSEFIYGADGEQRTAGYRLPVSLLSHLDAAEGDVAIYVIQAGAPAFGLSSRDRLIVKRADRFMPEHNLYVFRVSTGIEVARLIPTLGAEGSEVQLCGGNGEVHAIRRADVRLIGAVVGSISRR
jgi:transcriptional regulator with XRE-family HTH domain